MVDESARRRDCLRQTGRTTSMFNYAIERWAMGKRVAIIMSTAHECRKWVDKYGLHCGHPAVIPLERAFTALRGARYDEILIDHYVGDVINLEEYRRLLDVVAASSDACIGMPTCSQEQLKQRLGQDRARQRRIRRRAIWARIVELFTFWR